MMSDEPGTREEFDEEREHLMQRRNLFGCAVIYIGRWRVAVPAFKANAKRIVVEMSDMTSSDCDRAAVVDGAVAADVEVIAGISPEVTLCMIAS